MSSGTVPADGDDDLADFDLFSEDPRLRARLERMAGRVRANANSKVAEITGEVDGDQRKFVESTADTIRLLAPAGSGKTQSIVNRLLNLVSRGRSFGEFLVLTFDNSASLSLREKLDKGLAAAGLSTRSKASVLTLNKFGYQLIRGVMRDEFGDSAPDVISDSAAREAVRLALGNLRDKNADAFELLPRRMARKVYLDFFSALKNNLILAEPLMKKDAATLDAYLDLGERMSLFEAWLEPHFQTGRWAEAVKRLPGILAFVYRSYEKINRKNKGIDFDDQKLLPYLAMVADGGMTKRAMAPYTAVIVDEFQDINRLDFELIRLIAEGKQLTVVGDDDQSIYSFRGCSPDFIINFEQRVGRAVETHILRTNYRCPRNVVEMANRLIAHNTNRVPKEQVAHRSDDADVSLWHCLNSASEAQVIARFIKKLHTDRSGDGFQYADVAVLFRMHSQCLPLQMALIMEGIPYHCRRDENVIVSDLMKKLLGLIALHMRLRENMNRYSLTDTKLLCDCLVRYASDADVAKFHAEVVRYGGYVNLSGTDSTLAFPRGLTLSDFRRAIGGLISGGKPRELLERLTSDFKHLSGVAGTLEDAINNHLPLGEILDIAGRFKGDVEQFHAMLTGLLAKVEGGLYREGEGDGVNLLTYFRAKGRQWATVIIPGANQQVIPLGQSPIEDERRLFYVAVTRATSNLIIAYVRQAVRSKVEPSQFIEEMGLTESTEKRARVLT